MSNEAIANGTIANEAITQAAFIYKEEKERPNRNLLLGIIWMSFCAGQAEGIITSMTHNTCFITMSFYVTAKRIEIAFELDNDGVVTVAD